jgi:hypothetical protein
VFLIGGGPSLAGFDFEKLRGRRVITINRSFRVTPWADVLYFCDRNFWRVDSAEILKTFTGRHIVTVCREQHDRLKNIQNTGTSGLELRPIGVKHGTNSGYQAINLGFLMGARRLVLLGYDMKTAGGETHHHGGYRTGGVDPAQYSHVMQHTLQQRMLPYFPRLVDPLKAAGVEVFNANPDSALRCWPTIQRDQAPEL